MTAPTVAGARTWAAEVDVDQALAALRRRFPRTMTWHGEFTGSLWAAWRDRSGRVHLIEAADPDDLGRRLEDAGVQPAHPPQSPTEVPVADGMVAGVQWSPPPPPRPTAPAPPRPERRDPPKRPVRGRHEAERPPGVAAAPARRADVERGQVVTGMRAMAEAQRRTDTSVGACPAAHVRPPSPQAERLIWYALVLIGSCRVLASTCWRCSPVSYELVSYGGAYAIRRTHRETNAVQETPRVQQRRVAEWWSALLKGAAT